MFRGIPDISRSDWSFTYITLLIGQYCNIDPFDLLIVWQYKDHRVSGLIIVTVPE